MSVGDGCSTEVEQTPHYPLVVGSITAACVFYLFISISWVSLKQALCILKKITSQVHILVQNLAKDCQQWHNFCYVLHKRPRKSICINKKIICTFFFHTQISRSPRSLCLNSLVVLQGVLTPKREKWFMLGSNRVSSSNQEQEEDDVDGSCSFCEKTRCWSEKFFFFFESFIRKRSRFAGIILKGLGKKWKRRNQNCLSSVLPQLKPGIFVVYLSLLFLL